MWKRISSLARFTKKVDSAQNTREKTEENLERDLVNSKRKREALRNLKLREIAKKILAMKFLEYYLTCQNKEKKLLIVCLRELSCVCRKKKLISG